jgi:hypothetical protein
MLSIMEEAQARALYTFIYGRELRFRELLSKIFGAVAAGEHSVPEEPDLFLDRDKRVVFEWIDNANTLEEEKRNQNRPD